MGEPVTMVKDKETQTVYGASEVLRLRGEGWYIPGETPVPAPPQPGARFDELLHKPAPAPESKAEPPQAKPKAKPRK